MFRIWRMLLGLCNRTVLEDVVVDEDHRNGGRARASEATQEASLWTLWTASAVRGRRRGTTPVAESGPGHGAGVVGGRRAAGALA
ncbi:hypothetical protein BH23ACT10_BH23ACT10_20610 [soil metagenome]